MNPTKIIKNRIAEIQADLARLERTKHKTHMYVLLRDSYIQKLNSLENELSVIQQRDSIQRANLKNEISRNRQSISEIEGSTAITDDLKAKSIRNYQNQIEECEEMLNQM